MKNYKTAAIILATTVGLMGAGYGYWANKTKMKNTILTGNMKMELVKKSDELYHYPLISHSKYLETIINISPNDNTAEINIKNFYPNSYVLTNLQIINVGTIPTKIKDIKIECDNEDLAKYITCDIALGFNKDGKNYYDTKYEMIRGALGKDIEGKLNKVINDRSFIIYHDGYVVFGMPYGVSRVGKPEYSERYIRFFLPANVPNEIKNKNVNIKISINFEQF
jgi:hypothetical protein